MNRIALPFAGVAALVASVCTAHCGVTSAVGELSHVSTSELLELAYEYAWQEDYETERDVLAIAADRPLSRDSARAMILLAESYSMAGEAAQCVSLLDRVREQYDDPETLAFADIVQALSEMPAVYSTHARKQRSDVERSRQLYSDTAERWKGTWLGGWASTRHAAVLRIQLRRYDDSLAVLEQIESDYAGTPFGDYATEEMIATTAFPFGLGQAREGRARYEQLLATTEDDFLRQRGTLHLGELLMEHDNFVEGYEVLTTFIDSWPQYADSSGARMLRSYVAAELNRWGIAVSDARIYLSSGRWSEHGLCPARSVRLGGLSCIC